MSRRFAIAQAVIVLQGACMAALFGFILGAAVLFGAVAAASGGSVGSGGGSLVYALLFGVVAAGVALVFVGLRLGSGRKMAVIASALQVSLLVAIFLSYVSTAPNARHGDPPSLVLMGVLPVVVLCLLWLPSGSTTQAPRYPAPPPAPPPGQPPFEIQPLLVRPASPTPMSSGRALGTGLGVAGAGIGIGCLVMVGLVVFFFLFVVFELFTKCGQGC